MSALTASVVIPTRNRPSQLRRCLVALLSERITEAVVVITDPEDKSIALLEAWRQVEPRIRVVTADPALGRSGARQAGVELADSEVVIVIDDDVVAHPGLVEGHVAAHSAESGLVVLGYMPVQWPERAATATLYDREYESTCRRYESGEVEVLDALWGGNLSLRKEDALKVGFTSPGFENRYHEDTHFGLRCKAAGLTGRFVRTLRADHEYSRSVKAFLRDARSAGEARVLLEQRHGGEGTRLRPCLIHESSPAIVRPLIRMAGNPILLGMMTALLLPLTHVNGLSIPVLKLLRRMHQYRGSQATLQTTSDTPTGAEASIETNRYQ